MNFNYEKIRSRMEHGGNQWTGYSDLFLVLSTVFLLLYVVSNLRSGTASIASRSAVQAAKNESEELKKQIKAYEVLKDDYMKKGASQDEVELYQELMSKLTLLEDGAKTERNALYRKAQEAQEKEQALNRYQQVIKNIINANLVAQSRLKKREDVIVDQTIDIKAKDENITELSQGIMEREQEIDRNNQTISKIEEQLDSKVQALRNAYQHNKRSKAELESKIKKLNEETQSQISSLQQNNNKVASQLIAAQSELESKTRESQQLVGQLRKKETEFQESIESMKQAHEQNVARERAEYEKALRSAKLSAAEKIAKEKAYREGLERKTALYNEKMQGLNQQLTKTQGSLASLKGEKEALSSKLAATSGQLEQVKSKVQALHGEAESAKGQLAQAKGQLANTAGQLATANAKLAQQRMLAERMKQNFEKEGIHADVDLKTGDVVVRFENEYYDTGSSTLKTGMKSALQKLVPVYAKTLFQDDKIVKRISSVEIVGFASPTYQGKYVDPDSLSPEDRRAVNFNMDLSYQRAKGIFEYVFDPNKMQFSHQKKLLPLVKVSGRSYLAAERGSDRLPGSDSIESYCKVNDCRKSQKVIIKFNLKDE